MKMNDDNGFENHDGLYTCPLPHPFMHSRIQAGGVETEAQRGRSVIHSEKLKSFRMVRR